jgi:hypothetical protein
MEMVFRAGEVKIFWLLGFTLFCKFSCAQFYDHYTLRPSFQIQKQINDKIDINVEYQNRRQSGLGTNGNKVNILRLPYQESVRVWIISQFEKDSKQDRKAEFMISPFAYFTKWPLQGKPEDLEGAIRNEVRFTAMGEVFQYFRGLRVQNRTGYEYRIFFEDEGYRVRGRIRHRIQSQIKITGNYRINLNNEFFLWVPPNPGKQLFHENRIGGTLVYRTDIFRVESGYIFLYNPRSSLNEIDREHGLILNLTFYL